MSNSFWAQERQPCDQFLAAHAARGYLDNAMTSTDLTRLLVGQGVLAPTDIPKYTRAVVIELADGVRVVLDATGRVTL